MAEDGSVIIEIKGDASDFKKSMDDATKSTEKFGEISTDAINTFAAALAAAGVAATIEQITQALMACIAASAEFESAITGVFKTVDGTEKQLAGIADEIKRMSTEIPATTTEIAAVAEAAGQLGIATEDVLRFSKVMIDLGNSTNLSADQAATALARFANITGTTADNYERLGSVIVGLGNNFATTEAEITEMATRLASAGTLAGLSESNILALSAAMSSVGINAEAGGTAMTQTLSAIEEAVEKGGEKLQAFAEIAGISSEEFSSLWKKDAIKALQQFISGLDSLGEQGESAVLILDELGLSGVRQGNMIKSLALASEKMADAISLANEEWEVNTALATEAGKRYATLESQLQMAQNAFSNVKVAIGDALAPALRELAEVGTEAFTWAAGFIEEHPELVQAITAVVAALGTLLAGLTGLSVAGPLLSVFSKLGAVLATPQGAIVGLASAAVGLATALGSLVSSMKEATQESRDMLGSIQESRAEYESLTANIQQQNADIGGMVETLSMLHGSARLSTGSQKALLAVVEDLNQAVPNLSLAYDAETNSLNMTTQEILEAAEAYRQLQQVQADAERYAKLKTEQAELAAEIQRMEQQLAETPNYGIYTIQVYETSAALEELKNEAKENTEELARLAESIDVASNAQQEAADTLSGFTQKEKEHIEQINSAISKEKELEEITRSLAGAEGMLASALEEQAESGALSYGTTLDLIDAGYAAALAIDSETGAITLNAEAYAEITKAKIVDQLKSVEIQRASVENALALSDEALMVTYLAESYLTAADARDALEGKKASYSAQIAALQKLHDSIGNVEGSIKRTSSASVRASQKTITQAEKDLKTYQSIMDEMDHLRSMGIISEAEYYKNLAEYRDKYLTDEANVEEYRKITEKIHSYTESLVEQEKEQWQELIDEMTSLGDKLSSSELFTRSTQTTNGKSKDIFQLTDLQESIDQINAYGDAIEGLKARGISGGLLDEVLSMSTSDATEYANALLGMAEEEYSAYMSLWEEKEAAAQRVAAEIYATEFEALQTEYTGKLPEEMRTAGESAMMSLEDGLRTQGEAAIQAAAAIADEIAAQFRGIDIGAYSNQLKAVVEAETARVSSGLSYSSNAASEAQTAALNTQTAQLAYANSKTYSSQKRDVVLNVNGKEFARATIEDYRAVEDSIPRVEDD